MCRNEKKKTRVENSRGKTIQEEQSRKVDGASFSLSSIIHKEKGKEHGTEGVIGWGIERARGKNFLHHSRKEQKVFRQ